MADPLPVVPARENLRTVVESNTLGGRVSGNETVPIDSLFGVTSPSKRAQDAITDIVSQMSGPEGYIERLIVDQDGNVIEGAHRLEALRRLGISEVPITRIVDPTANLDLPSLQDAIRGVGKIHPDHVNQIMSQVGDMLASTGNNPEKVLEEYTFPEGYEKYFEAALNSVSLGKPRPTDQPGPEEPTTPPGWSPYETPAGNLARNVPAVLEGVPLISEILRLWYDERLPEQRPEEPVRGRGLQTRQGKGQILRKIFRRVGKVNLPLRILDSVERYYSLLSPGQQEGLGEFLQTFAEHAGPTVIPPKVWEKIVGTVAKPQQGIASLGEAMGISEDDLPVIDPRTTGQPGPEGGIASLPVIDITTRDGRAEFNQRRVSAFAKLASDQVGNPEVAMTRAQNALGGGVVNYVIEHVGDLTNRMAAKYGEFSEGLGYDVGPKVQRSLRELRSKYGFARDHAGNMAKTADYRGISLEEHTAEVNAALKEYADAHRNLEVFNEPQEWARDAAVALGEQNWAEAERLLTKLDTLMQDENAYRKAVGTYRGQFIDQRGADYDLRSGDEPGPEGGIASLPVDDLPLTGAQRGELLNLYKTRTWKSKPRNAVNDLVRNGYWPEELRSDGIAFLEGSAKIGSARQRRVYDQEPDPLASREPGHAIRKFEAKKRHQLEEEARRSNEAAIRERGEALQGLDEEGLWNKKAVGEIASLMNSIERMGIGYVTRTIARANMEAVPRALKKEGWTVRHASKGRDKRRSSRYIVSPDRRFEVRLSDHYLPDTPEREYMHSQTGGSRWDEDIVVSGTESPRSIIDEIKDLYIKSVDDRKGYASGGFVDKPLYESARLIG
jgi:hypothetical protein